MEEKEQATIAELIKYHRKNQKMTQEQLCEATGISISTLKKYETGLRHPKAEQLQRIAEALGISDKEFMPIKVKRRSDILLSFIQLDKEANLDWGYKTNEDGLIIPETVTISFEDHKLNKLLALYLTAKNKTKDETELEQIIRTLLYTAKLEENNEKVE